MSWTRALPFANRIADRGLIPGSRWVYRPWMPTSIYAPVNPALLFREVR